MAATAVEVVSPAKVLYTGEAEMVVCRSVDGEIAFLADHVPYLGALSACVVRVLPGGGGEETRIAISGGFVEVRDNRVVILADAATMSHEVDVELARSRRNEAETRMRDDPTDAAASAAFAEATSLLEAAGIGTGD